ncbi:MAG: hypothetical protein ACK5X8_02135, partial [Planctomyces sp.]
SRGRESAGVRFGLRRGVFFAETQTHGEGGVQKTAVSDDVIVGAVSIGCGVIGCFDAWRAVQ